ncbi:MAG: protein-disulfide reductase DsbD family protein [Gammaproteobacteria bacterium]
MARPFVAQWDVADGYYLYRSKFDFKIDTPGVTLGTVDVPHGQFKEDENFGKVEIMHGNFAVDLPLQFAADSPAPTKVNLTVGYQGCAEDGICYPPPTRQSRLRHYADQRRIHHFNWHGINIWRRQWNGE